MEFVKHRKQYKLDCKGYVAPCRLWRHLAAAATIVTPNDDHLGDPEMIIDRRDMLFGLPARGHQI